MEKKAKVKRLDKPGFRSLMSWKSPDITAEWTNILILSYLSVYASDAPDTNAGMAGKLLLASKMVNA